MPLPDAQRFIVQEYDQQHTNQYGICGDELTPGYGNTHRPSSKKFITVNCMNKITAMDLWDTIGNLLDGCGLKLQR
jgi:hypothetical protein